MGVGLLVKRVIASVYAMMKDGRKVMSSVLKRKASRTTQMDEWGWVKD